jgi:cardiolipin synthase A/B
MTIVVAIPIRRVSAKAILEKGRGWSAVDEIVLWALSRETQSASKLAEELNLPRRLVLRIILRMMRFRFVESDFLNGLPAFRTTAYGSAVVASGSEIPTAKQRLSRNVAFVYDTISGTVYQRRDVDAKPAIFIETLRDRGVDVRDIKVRGKLPRTTPAENFVRIQRVLREDESLLFFDGDTFVERQNEFMMVVVDGNDMRGLPKKAPTALEAEISRVANSKEITRPIVVESMIEDDDPPVLPTTISMRLADDDLVFGGEAHSNLLKRVLSQARRRIFIHSTFLRRDAFTALAREFRDAVRKGVKIDIFWGSGTTDEPGEKTMKEALAVAKIVAGDELLRDRVRIHLKSTGSHAKILIADDGSENFVAVVGSCNWLYSSFDRFELSVLLREPALVAQAVETFGALVAKPGFRPETGAELYVTSRVIARRPAEGGPHFARFVTGQAHEAVLREASGSQPTRFLIASDKFGNSAFPNAIIPAEVAAATARTEPVVVYGSTAGKVTGIGAANLTFDVRERGVRLLRISEGFHAKFLLWGDDDIVITSINWCSWTSPPDSPLGEIGVHIHRTGLASALAHKLSLIWPNL